MRVRSLLICTLVALFLGSPGLDAFAAESGEIPLGPLPRDVVPQAYSLELTVVPERDRFMGQTIIDVDIRQPTKLIWMHGRDLKVRDAKLVTADGEEIAVRYSQVDPSGVVRLDLAGEAPAGPAKLEFLYSAPFNRSLEGLYKVVEEGHSYIFTQFEPISARLAFPGFDEPGFKAPFDITLNVNSGDVAITNTPVEKATDLGDGMKRLHFKRTAPLPTYLIAFIVGDLDVIDGPEIPATDIRDHPIPVRGVAAKGKGAELKFALDHTPEIVTGLESYFGRPYPFDKLDIIAAVDFAAGAMENAGTIVYREQSILTDDHAPLDQKRNILVTHAHELSHQWFGDLVTPAWWDDIWLNESFATWMSYRTLNALYPGQYYDRDMLRNVQSAFDADSLVSARQIRQPVADRNGISSAFDSITYEKGGGVLSMLESYLGPDRFRAGTRAYLNQFAFGTATADDLIRSISEATKDTQVVAAFNSFLSQPGLPLLDVKRECGANGAGRLHLGQSRYLPLGSAGSPDRAWNLPVCLSLRKDGTTTKRCEIMAKREIAHGYGSGECPDVVMPNAGGAGYYRWTLDRESWDRLFAVVADLPVTEQLSIADSLAAALSAGKISTENYIDRAEKLAASDEWDVSTAPLGTLGFILDYLTPEKGKKALRHRLAGFYSDKLKTLGLDADTPRDKSDPIGASRLRSGVVGFLAAKTEDKHLRRDLAKKAKAFIGFRKDGALHRDVLNPDLVGVALMVGAEDLGRDFTQALLALLPKTQDGVLRGQILWAVGHVRRGNELDKVRALTMSDALRNNEVPTILYAQMSEPATRPGMWDWLRANYKSVRGRFANWRQQQLIRMPGGFCTPERRDEVETFFKPYAENIEGGTRALASTLERMNLCIAMKERYGNS